MSYLYHQDPAPDQGREKERAVAKVVEKAEAVVERVVAKSNMEATVQPP
jgi:hypothetical protein